MTTIRDPRRPITDGVRLPGPEPTGSSHTTWRLMLVGVAAFLLALAAALAPWYLSARLLTEAK